MNKFKLFGLAVAVTFSANVFAADDAQASYVVFADDFETSKSSSVQNVQRLPQWLVGSQGSLDVIKAGDFGLSCGGGSQYCMDLDGSSKAGGSMTTKATFGPGTYQLEFDYTGNQRSFLGGNAMDGDVMEVSLGDWSKKFRTMPDDPFKHVSITFTTNAAGELSFSQLGMSFDYYGIILDNVKLTYISGGSGPSSIINGPTNGVAQVPEPTTLALFGAGLAGLGIATRRRRKK